MSQENVEIVKAMIETWETHGFDATIAAFDPDVEVVDLQSALGMKERGRGPEELRRLAGQWTEIFDPWTVEVLEIIDLGGEWVMAHVSFHGVGRDSGTPVSNTQFELYRLIEGKIAEMRVGFQDQAAALAWLAENPSPSPPAAGRRPRPLSRRGRR